MPSQAELNDENWEQRFQELLTCRQPDGSLRVLTNGPKSIIGLSTWCTKQRKAYMRGKLSPERVARLEAVGFRWDYDYGQQAWMDKYQELERFYQKHGHTRLTSTTPGCSRLFAWAERQRYRHKEGRLEEDRVRLLEALAFPWGEEASANALKAEAFERVWQARRAELAAFKERHGHCLVPNKWEENLKLAMWVRSQRGLHKHGELPAARVAALEALGFVWDTAAEVRRLQAEDPALLAAVHALTPERRLGRRKEWPVTRG